MQSAPRPLASVSLGGSLRASRAALLARPHGPLAVVDLADGRALSAEDLGAGWIVSPSGDDAPTLRGPVLPDDAVAEPPPAPARRRRLGTALVLAGALGAAVVALAGGFSAAPAPAVAGPVAQAHGSRPSHAATPQPGARGGRASALPRPEPPPPPQPAPVVAPPAPPPPPPPPPPAPPPLPELPSAPAL